MAVDVEALAAWADFPAAAGPRPKVVVDGFVEVGPSGFVGGNAKLAFLHGTIDSRIELPDGVFALLAPRFEDQPGGSDRKITITAITRIEAAFGTDRGPQLFPAYALDLDGTREPVVVLDPATPVWWPPIGRRLSQPPVARRRSRPTA